jgi:hypothetical protein
MDDDPSTFCESRCEHLEDLDAILVCPIMEYGTEIVDICRKRLRCEEVAVSIVNMRFAIDYVSYYAMNVTLSFRSAGSRTIPSATVSGRS